MEDLWSKIFLVLVENSSRQGQFYFYVSLSLGVIGKLGKILVVYSQYALKDFREFSE